MIFHSYVSLPEGNNNSRSCFSSTLWVRVMIVGCTKNKRKEKTELRQFQSNTPGCPEYPQIVFQTFQALRQISVLLDKPVLDSDAIPQYVFVLYRIMRCLRFQSYFAGDLQYVVHGKNDIAGSHYCRLSFSSHILPGRELQISCYFNPHSDEFQILDFEIRGFSS